MGGLISCWSVTNFQILWNVPSMNGCGRSSELSIEFEGMTGGSSEYLLSGMNPSGGWICRLLNVVAWNLKIVAVVLFFFERLN